MPKAKTIEERNNVCKLYLDGYNGMEISRMLNYNFKTVYKILWQNKITRNASDAKRKFYSNENYFDNIITHRQAYWLGFISGDGSIIKNQLVINLSIRDKIILEQFKKDIESENLIKTYKKFVSITITSTHMTNVLKQHNIIPNKTKSFTLSKIIPEHLLSSYILGLIDADGCFSVDKTRGLRLSLVGTIKSMQEIQDILIASCKVNRNKLQKHHTTSYIKYLVYSGDRQLIRIVDFLYGGSDFFLPRKYNIVKKYFELE